ncbi:sterol carrier family protein [Rothia sp. P7208]|uniref:sterol carrier family protein n=1 Tax=Rothia sp. P7208 TaxID=3402660 RepID=UPI003AC4973B
MSTRRKISLEQGIAYISEIFQVFESPEPEKSFEQLPRSVQAGAVRFLLEELAYRAPGNSVEVRVPPFGVTQCIAGPRHTRGTPANVIEMTPYLWCALACGVVDWQEKETHISASGVRANLRDILPLYQSV